MPNHENDLSFEDELVIILAMAMARATTRRQAAAVVGGFRAAVREWVEDGHTRRLLRAAARLAVFFWKQHRQRLQ